MKKVDCFNPIVLGRIGSCYGIQGWLRVFSYTENSTNIFDYQPWFIQQGDKWRKLVVESWRHHNQYILFKLESINDRNTANLLTNCNILVDSSKLVKLEEDNYYWKDLIGCQVITTKGYDLGEVINMIETRSNDVLVIKANPKDTFSMKERLIPFLRDRVVKKVLLDNKTIEVDWDPSF